MTVILMTCKKITPKNNHHKFYGNIIPNMKIRDILEF